jgi:hypothetical protein
VSRWFLRGTGIISDIFVAADTVFKEMTKDPRLKKGGVKCLVVLKRYASM